jgi:hypothetical protein
MIHAVTPFAWEASCRRTTCACWTMVRAIAKADRAVDLAEGRLVTELDQTGKPVGASYQPEDPARLPPLPPGCA